MYLYLYILEHRHMRINIVKIHIAIILSTPIQHTIHTAIYPYINIPTLAIKTELRPFAIDTVV